MDIIYVYMYICICIFYIYLHCNNKNEEFESISETLLLSHSTSLLDRLLSWPFRHLPLIFSSYLFTNFNILLGSKLSEGLYFI